MKPQTVQIVRQGEATPYWFKFNPLYIFRRPVLHLLHYGRLKPVAQALPADNRENFSSFLLIIFVGKAHATRRYHS